MEKQMYILRNGSGKPIGIAEDVGVAVRAVAEYSLLTGSEYSFRLANEEEVAKARKEIPLPA